MGFPDMTTVAPHGLEIIGSSQDDEEPRALPVSIRISGIALVSLLLAITLLGCTPTTASPLRCIDAVRSAEQSIALLIQGCYDNAAATRETAKAHLLWQPSRPIAVTRRSAGTNINWRCPTAHNAGI